ncbi:hypothetical protein BDZ45DRAFT_812178 [Acephala macrosclerotiorum]|nr:hypothetical protein BDZ45DRAFT_812178 [Acephala macrosclerotiorum]
METSCSVETAGRLLATGLAWAFGLPVCMRGRPGKTSQDKNQARPIKGDKVEKSREQSPRWRPVFMTSDDRGPRRTSWRLLNGTKDSITNKKLETGNGTAALRSSALGVQVKKNVEIGYAIHCSGKENTQRLSIGKIKCGLKATCI